MANLGDLVVRVGGDIDGFKAAMQEGSAVAGQFGATIERQLSLNLTQTTEDLFLTAKAGEQMGFQFAAANSEVKGLKDSLAQMSKTAPVSALTDEITKTSNAAQGMGFNFRYAFFGIKDLMEGRTKFAIAELANELVAMGGSALLVAGGVAAVGAAGYAIYKMANYARDAREETNALTEALAELDRPITRVNDQLTLTADKLANEIARLEHKPENGLAIALDEARVLSDRLTDSLDQTLKKVGELMGKQKTPWYELLTPGTKDTDKRLEELKRQVNADSGNPAAQSQDFQFELQKVQADIVKTLAARSKESGRVDFGPELARLREYATVYQGEIDRIAREQKVADLTQQKDKLEASEKNRRQSEDALKKQEQAIKAANSEMLADLKSDHELTKGEEIAFWQSRLSEVDQFGTRYKSLHREISVTLGTLYQEQDKERERDQESLQRWAQKLHDTNQKVEQSNRELTDRFAGYAEKYAESRAKIEAADAKKLFEPKADIAQTPIEAPLQQRLGGTAVGAGLTLQSAGFKSAEVQQSEIKYQQEILRLAVATNAPIEQQIQLRERILRSEIALGESQGQNVSSLISALGKLQTEEDRLKTKAEGFAPLFLQLKKQLSPENLGNQLGGALGRGLINGKNIGQEIAHSLKGIGQQMMGNVFQKLISTMLLQIGTQTGLIAATTTNAGVTTLHAGVMVTHMGAVVAHMGALVANTIAVAWNSVKLALLTAVEAVKTFFGFAEGGVPPVGVPSIVGEKGPELFIPHQLGTIIPNHQLRNFATTGGSIRTSSSSSSSSQAMSFGDIHVHGVQNPREMMRAIATYAKTASPQFSPFASR